MPLTGDDLNTIADLAWETGKKLEKAAAKARAMGNAQAATELESARFRLDRAMDALWTAHQSTLLLPQNTAPIIDALKKAAADTQSAADDLNKAAGALTAIHKLLDLIGKILGLTTLV